MRAVNRCLQLFIALKRFVDVLIIAIAIAAALTAATAADNRDGAGEGYIQTL
jgi:hypothetical protein